MSGNKTSTTKPSVPNLKEEIEEAVLGNTEVSEDKEARQISSGKSLKELRTEAQKNEHDRSEKFKDLFEKLFGYFMLIAFAFLVAIVSVMVIHLILPVQCEWLSEKKFNMLKNLLTGSIVGGVLQSHLRKRL